MIRLEGMSQLQNQLDQMGKRLESGTKDRALKAGGEFMRDKIKAETPVRTHNLQDSIIESDIKDDIIAVGSEISETDSTSQGRAYYGRFVEFGTSKMDPQPFMGPAYEQNKDAVQEVMRDVIKRELGL